MTPYYERDNITILHGDCSELLEEYEGLRMKSFDLLLTDPPYGVDSNWAAQTTGGLMTKAEAARVNAWDAMPAARTIQRAIAIAKLSIIWGGNYLADVLGRTRAPLIWDKGQRGMHFADGEMAWTNFDWGTLRIFALRLVDSDTKGMGVRLHPTQKPEELMAWCIRQAARNPLQSVIDPFMGSGTTLVACKRIGLRCVGIEIEERYCEIAAKRLAQGVLPLEMPEPPVLPWGTP